MDQMISIKELIESIEKEDFQCEGGPLTSCMRWQTLKGLISGISISDLEAPGYRTISLKYWPVIEG